MDRYGEILIVKNIVFPNGTADHASLGGRPCLALSDSNDILTLLTLTHKKTIDEKYLFKCNSSDFYKSQIKVQSYINMRSLIQKNIYFYDPIAVLKLEKYYMLLNRLLELELEKNKYCADIYESIYDDLISQKEQLDLRFKKRY